MRSSILSRLRPPAGRDDAGVYAVLYALLVVILVGIAAIVVDIAGLRQDRRDNRAAADSAAVAGAEFLNPVKGGIQPKKACDRAWLYLSKTLSGLPAPSTPCSEFTGVTPNTYCSAAYPSMIPAQRTVGDRTVIIAWPVPQDNPATAGVDESHKFLNPDVAPDHTGGVTQVFASDRDGSVGGCDRLGVAVIDHRSFGLASGIGIKGQATSIHSVARFDTKGGFQEQIAALNLFNLSDCRTLSTTGGGKVLVGPTVDNLGNVVGPGIIAVDSTGTTGCTGSPNADGTGGGDRVIDPANATGNLICAASVPIPATGPTAGGPLAWTFSGKWGRLGPGWSRRISDSREGPPRCRRAHSSPPRLGPERSAAIESGSSRGPPRAACRRGCSA